MNKARAEGALTCSCDDKVQWNPAGPTCPWRLLPEAPPPAATDKLRLVQLRTFARRFACGDLRLMPTPLDRYASPKHRVTDGAWLALATGNDLEILIALEAIADDVGDLRWRYSLGRMNASGMQVRLDDREVWNYEGYWNGRREKSETYVEQFDSRLLEELSAPSKPPAESSSQARDE